MRVEIRDDEAIQDLDQAIDYLKKLDSVDGSRIALIGVCQTGRQPLLLAAHRNDITAVVVLYGAIGGREWLANELRPTPADQLVTGCASPVLGIFGEADHIISIDDVLKFRGCLEQSKKSYHVRIYHDAPHGWLNDTMPGRYRKEAAKDAWNLMMSFLKKSSATAGIATGSPGPSRVITQPNTTSCTDGVEVQSWERISDRRNCWFSCWLRFFRGVYHHLLMELRPRSES